MKEIPNTFGSVAEYLSVLEPLLLEELRSQLEATTEEGFAKITKSLKFTNHFWYRNTINPGKSHKY